jgi:hypothetical protein
MEKNIERCVQHKASFALKLHETIVGNVECALLDGNLTSSVNASINDSKNATTKLLKEL